MEYEQLACCVHGYYAAVGELLVGEELLACQRKPNTAIGTYRGSKDRRLFYRTLSKKLSPVWHELE